MNEPLVHYRLTAPGVSALGSIFIEGPGAARWLARHLVRARTAQMPPAPDRIHFARFPVASGSTDGEHVVVCALSDDRVEVHCHGGAGVEMVARRLTELGCRPATSECSWRVDRSTRRTESEALGLLPWTRTQRTAAILLDQWRGCLGESIESIVEHLRSARDREAVSEMERLLATYRIGRHLVEPYHVVLAGRPNSGKSSLLNRLLGHRRALVDDRPGTTRDLLEADAAFDGWLVRLYDMAGWRATTDRIESAGMALGRRRLHRADLVVWVIDGSSGAQDGGDIGHLFEDALPDGLEPLVVHNKSDLGIAAVHGRVELPISALRGDGIDALIDQIVARLVPDPPSSGDAVLFTPQQEARVQEAVEATARGDRERAVKQLLAIIDR